jgi:hypothetical protein
MDEPNGEKTIYVVKCPHCSILVEVVELNCRIFRCGIFKETYQQINPHLSKKECDDLVLNNSIYGCGKPFQIPAGSSDPVICDYI